MTPARLYFLVGRPASGKETQSKLLAEKLGCGVFSTGQEFRKAIAEGTMLGRAMKTSYEKGLLMPAWIPDYFFENFMLNLPEDKSAVFEGSARDVTQAKTIESVCEFLNRPYTIFNLEVSEESVMKRSLGRGRADGLDQAEVMKTRLTEYRNITGPALEYFKSIGKLVEINGEPTVEEIHAEVLTHVATLK